MWTKRTKRDWVLKSERRIGTGILYDMIQECLKNLAAFDVPVFEFAKKPLLLN